MRRRYQFFGSKYISLKEYISILIQISLNIVCKALMILLANKPWFVQVMALCRNDDKQLYVPITAQFNDAYMRYHASMHL